MEHKAIFRFYEELNDFLPSKNRKVPFDHEFNGKPSVKDAIESLGVPHTEVDLILIDGVSVGFEQPLHPGDTVSVYPVFEALDITQVARLRPTPLRTIAFVLDVHLGRLAAYLRILGFDSLYRNDYEDPEIIRISLEEGRIILTRDLGILKNKRVTHGYWLRSQLPVEQLREVMERLDLAARTAPFTRCPVCNGLLERVAKSAIEGLLPPETGRHYQDFSRCRGCGKLYWKGSHYEKLLRLVKTHTPQ
ncbi:MAG TPA: Mut7-C RNAse domain-containing protein [Spirochaetia bacterium]|nr:Mut7-C RNAse domain-containing protein [Spirochaetia bacterium]